MKGKFIQFKADIANFKVKDGVDNVQDWSDSMLQETYDWIEKNGKSNEKYLLLAGLIINEMWRRKQISLTNYKYQKAKEIMLKEYERAYDRNGKQI